jgi:CRISPR-associated protein Cst2
VYRDEKISYTAGNPIEYWDDDLFGYMRAPGDGVDKREGDPLYQKLTPLDKKKNKKGQIQEQAITRTSPFRLSTFVSVAPVSITSDYGTMVRQETGTAMYPEGPDPVPFEHQFYRATMQGLMSIDLRRVGRFTYRDKSGYRNLDETRIEIAQEKGLVHLEGEAAYLMSSKERQQRVSLILSAISYLQGGAKQAIHYTDVNPDLVMLAVTKGGNNIFGHVISANSRGLLELDVDALDEAMSVNSNTLLSPVYVGWVKGYLNEQRARFEDWLKPVQPNPDTSEGEKANEQEKIEHHNTLVERIHLKHPREAFAKIIEELDAHADELFK